MIRYFSTKLLIPLVLLTVVALSIHRYWSAGGFFINLATTFIGILLSVFYVGRVQDTYKEIKWLRVRRQIAEHLLLSVNVLLTSVNNACKSTGQGYFEAGTLYQSARQGIEHSTLELMRLTESQVKPMLHQSVASFGTATWKTLIANISGVHNAIMNCLIIFGTLLKPEQYELVLNLHTQLFNTISTCRLFLDVLTQTENEADYCLGDDSDQTRDAIIEFCAAYLDGLLECTKNLGRYQLEVGKKYRF